jgi:hypothetical protein
MFGLWFSTVFILTFSGAVFSRFQNVSGHIFLPFTLHFYSVSLFRQIQKLQEINLENGNCKPLFYAWRLLLQTLLFLDFRF